MDRRRWLLLLYPIAMGLALVYLGEHYVMDLVIGALYAVIAYAAARAITRRFAERRPLVGSG
jgi:membrane-associated phospholipid phosphatase